MNNFSRSSIALEELIFSLKKDMLLKSVYQRILYQRVIAKAAEQRGVTVTPEEIQAEADRFRSEKRLEKASATLAWLADEMVTAEDWEEGIRDRLLTKKLAESLFAKQVEKHFAQNKLDYEQISIYQIIVPYAQVAQELFYEIEEQEISFYEAAHLYDIDPQRRHRCGYEGKLYRWSFKPNIAAAIFSANPGELIGPLKTEQGYHLFIVEEFIPAELTPEIKQNILDKMFKDWLASELNYMLHS